MVRERFCTSILSFLIIFLLFDSSKGFDDDDDLPIQGYCKEAAETDPNLSYAFCVASLESQPRSQTADLEELVDITLLLTVSNATRIASYVSKLLEEEHMDKYTRCALADCLELYLDAKSTLLDAICDFKSRDYFKANLDASAAMDASSTCEDGFKERQGGSSPLTKENTSFFELTAMVLAFLKMLSN